MQFTELLLAARDSSLQGEHQRAVDLCAAALAQKPKDPHALAFLGLAQWRARSFADAVSTLYEALKHFPGQYELSIAMLESLHCLGRETQALSFAATLPDAVRSQPQVSAILRALELSAAGLRPAPAVTASLLRLHEQGDFEELHNRLLALLPEYPGWNFGQTLLASCMFMSSGRALTGESMRFPAAATSAELAEEALRCQLGEGMSAAREQVLRQIDIALSRSAEDAHARELLIRTRFEEGVEISAGDMAHIGAEVGSPLAGPFRLVHAFDKGLHPAVEVRQIEAAAMLAIPEPLSVGSLPLDLAGAVGPALRCARYVGEAWGAKVCAGSEVVLLPDGKALSHSLTHPLGELVNYHFDSWIVLGSVTQLMLRDLPTVSVPGVAISLLGPAVRFYGHWLMDSLIRFRALDGHPAMATACLLVDDDMPKSHIEALQLLVGTERAMRRVPKGTCVQTERLLFAGPEVFFPHAARYGAPSMASVAPSAVGGMAYLRQRIHAAVGGGGGRHGRRLMVRRNSSTRRVVNENQLSELLVKEWGFEEVWPETLEFADQVRCFRNAHIIVGTQGSAMSNCVFCTHGARVVSLCSTFAANFPSWADALEQIGIRHCFAVGDVVANSHALAIQRDIHIDPNDLLEALAKLGVSRSC